MFQFASTSNSVLLFAEIIERNGKCKAHWVSYSEQWVSQGMGDSANQLKAIPASSLDTYGTYYVFSPDTTFNLKESGSARSAALWEASKEPIGGGQIFDLENPANVELWQNAN